MNSRTWAWICIAGIIIFSVLGLISYITDIEWLSSMGDKYIPMAPLTAVIFIVVAVVLILLNNQGSSTSGFKITFFLSALIFLIGLLFTVDYFVIKKTNIENYLFPSDAVHFNIPVFRMAPATSLVFILAGFDLMLYSIQKAYNIQKMVIEYFEGFLSLLILIVSYVASLGYLYGKPLLYTGGNVIPMAVSTSLGFLLYSVSILIIRREHFPLKLLRSGNTDSMLLRFILPVSLLPILIIQISVLFSLKNVSVIPVFITTSISLVLAVVVGFLSTYISNYLANIIGQQKNMIENSEKIIRIGEEKYLNLFKTMAQGVVYQDSEGKIIEANPAAERILGLSADQMMGKTSVDPCWRTIDKDGNDLPGNQHPAMIALQTGKAVNNFIMGVYNPRSDRYVWIMVNAIPIFRSNEDSPRQVYATFLDISDLKKLNDENQQLKEDLEKQVQEKTKELNQQISELEHFFQVSVDRELRMEELRHEITQLKNQLQDENKSQN